MRNQLISLSYLYNGDFNKIYQYLKNNNNNINVSVNNNFINYLKNSKIDTITILDNDYPESLRNLPNPPFVLYCKGELNLLKDKALHSKDSENNTIGVIGSRNPTDYGAGVTEHLVSHMVSNGYIIVSGLALGIDGLAHKAAIENNGKTIAVIGSGFNAFYPKENAYLLNKVHLLISEYPPSLRACKHHFPMRNRIVAALSDKIVIVEAKVKSGTMITCHYAQELGKEIFCVPGSFFSENSEGCHVLIDEGARILYNFNDLL